jgi:hypothetical protein
VTRGLLQHPSFGKFPSMVIFSIRAPSLATPSRSSVQRASVFTVQSRLPSRLNRIEQQIEQQETPSPRRGEGYSQLSFLGLEQKAKEKGQFLKEQDAEIVGQCLRFRSWKI